MSLNGPQFEQLHSAILDAFDQASLAQMVRFRLDENLEAIAGGTNLSETVYRLISWSERSGRTGELISGALLQQPANPQLQAVKLQYDQIAVVPLASDRTVNPKPKWGAAQPSSQSASSSQNNLRVLRRQVERFWIKDVLERSLTDEAFIQLEIMDRSSSVLKRPWRIMTPKAGETDRRLAPDTKIIEVFDRMDQCMLMLGEPGAGKTTCLLELAQTLLARADMNPNEPSPIVLNLSSWGESEAPLADWIVEELSIRYNTPKKVAEDWVEHDRLLLLLDGLDEVQPNRRDGCVVAINQFLQEHTAPMVVCCRVAEYDNLTLQLRLQGAIQLQALTHQQVDNFLNLVAPKLDGVRLAIESDTDLRELTTSPLMLSVIALAYRDTPISNLDLDASSIVTRRQHLFDSYILRMFERRDITAVCSPRDTLHYLHWLASRLRQHGQTLFFIEQMQPEWMYSSEHNNRTPYVMLLASLLYGLLIAVLFVFVLAPVFIPLNALAGGRILHIIATLLTAPNTVDLSFFGGLFAVIVITLLVMVLLISSVIAALDGLFGRFRQIGPLEDSNTIGQRLDSSLKAGLFWGAIGAVFGSRLDSYDGVWLGGLAGALGGALAGGMTLVRFDVPTFHSWARLRVSFRFGALFGAFVGAVGGMWYSLLNFRMLWIWNASQVPLALQSYGLRWLGQRHLTMEGNELFFGIAANIACGLLLGIAVGLVFGLFFRRYSAADMVINSETIVPNEGIRLAGKYALITSLIAGVIIAVYFIVLWKVLLLPLLFGYLASFILGWVAGGDALAKHCILRMVLSNRGDVPWNYAQFLAYSTKLIFMRQVGGGYMFVHRLILEHFADLTNDDIQRIASTPD